MVDIDILYNENCPNYTKACRIICDIIAEQELNANINITKVTNPKEHTQFRGSPTVLVNKFDVELCFNDVNELENEREVVNALACRLYNCEQGRGCPSHEMIRCSIENLLQKQA